MADHPTDIGACLERVVHGDPEAARLLIERSSDLVARIVRAHRPRTVPVEDLVQEVYLKLFSRLGQYRPRGGVPFEHWLARLAVRTCLDALRQERRRPWSTALPLSPGAVAWLESLLSDRQTPLQDALPARERSTTLVLQR